VGENAEFERHVGDLQVLPNALLFVKSILALSSKRPEERKLWMKMDDLTKT
jgi:hypothetical protein